MREIFQSLVQTRFDLLIGNFDLADPETCNANIIHALDTDVAPLSRGNAGYGVGVPLFQGKGATPSFTDLVTVKARMATVRHVVISDLDL